MTFEEICVSIKLMLVFARFIAAKDAMRFYIRQRLIVLLMPLVLRRHIPKFTLRWWWNVMLRDAQRFVIDAVKTSEHLGPTALNDMALLKLLPAHRSYILEWGEYMKRRERWADFDRYLEDK